MRKLIQLIVKSSHSTLFLFVVSLYHTQQQTLYFCPVSGIYYRKSCASSGACLIASSGYQQFCTGKLNSVCITCCNTPLCNGPRQKKRPQPSAAITLTTPQLPLFSLYILLLLSPTLCWQTFTHSVKMWIGNVLLFYYWQDVNQNCGSWKVHTLKCMFYKEALSTICFLYSPAFCCSFPIHFKNNTPLGYIFMQITSQGASCCKLQGELGVVRWRTVDVTTSSYILICLDSFTNKAYCWKDK